MDADTLEIAEESASAHATLASDERWVLARRIAGSRTLKRAAHLQKILLFVTKACVLRPDTVVREGDIAQGVLGRRDDFDPAYDTIVRVQIGHLRHKLADYFLSEGALETVRLTLPRGSYMPVFVPVPANLPEAVPAGQDLPEEPAQMPSELPSAAPPRRRPWRWTLAAGLLLVPLVAGFAWWASHRSSPPSGASAAGQIFPILAKPGGRVAVVLPDTSLLLIQKLLGLEIPLESYTQTSYPMNLSRQATEPGMQKALHLIGLVRTTTLDEASAGTNFMQALTAAGLQGDLRYARDLHIRDLGEGSYILIGNQRSNPWVTLFTANDNFQFVGSPLGEQRYVFRNLHPRPGEAAEYAPVVTGKGSLNFVDITLLPNLTGSGYVLLIIGSDVPANEAAARFLMGGDLPREVERALQRGHPRSVEILLKGHHLYGESNDGLSIVAYRADPS